MSKDFLDRVDEKIVEQMMAWVAEIPGLGPDGVTPFRVDHAAYALYLIDGYLRDWANIDERGRFLFAVDMAYWWWFDDHIDDHIDEPTTRVAWDEIERVLGHGVPLPAPAADESPDVAYIRKLNDELVTRPHVAEDHAWWVMGTLRTLRGFREEEVAIRARAPWTFAEQLEAGMGSCTMLNITSTASMLMGFGFGKRHPLEPSIAERLLCLTTRIENDRMSFAKEKTQELAPSTAIILSRTFDRDRVLAFLEEQQAGYHRRLNAALAPLGPQHPLTLLANGILRTHATFYASGPKRYADPDA